MGFRGNGCVGEDEDRDAVLDKCTVRENKLVSFAQARKAFDGVDACAYPRCRMDELFQMSDGRKPSPSSIMERHRGKCVSNDRRRRLLVGGAAATATQS